jgi:hypothetical protein
MSALQWPWTPAHHRVGAASFDLNAGGTIMVDLASASMTLDDFMTLIRVERDLVHGQSIIGEWRGHLSNFHQKR